MTSKLILALTWVVLGVSGMALNHPKRATCDAACSQSQATTAGCGATANALTSSCFCSASFIELYACYYFCTLGDTDAAQTDVDTIAQGCNALGLPIPDPKVGSSCGGLSSAPPAPLPPPTSSPQALASSITSSSSSSSTLTSVPALSTIRGILTTTTNSTSSSSTSMIPTSIAPVLPITSVAVTTTFIKNTDPRITYNPPASWTQINNTPTSSSSTSTPTGDTAIQSSNSLPTASLATPKARRPAALGSISVPACAESGDIGEGSGAGSNVTFSFTGSGIEVHTISSNLGGVYSISIDGSNPQSLDSYANAVDPTNPVCSVPYSNQALDSTQQHTIVMQIVGNSPQAPLDTSGSGILDFDGFLISSPLKSSAGLKSIPSGIPLFALIVATGYILIASSPFE